MLMVAWSFVHSAIYYARRQRLSLVLNNYLCSPIYLTSSSSGTSLVCRPLRPVKMDSARFVFIFYYEKFEVFESKNWEFRTGTIYKAPSEPSIYYRDEAVEDVLFCNEQREIVVQKVQVYKLFITRIFFLFSRRWNIRIGSSKCPGTRHSLLWGTSKCGDQSISFYGFRKLKSIMRSSS
jgi:hypothetical protein